MPNHATMFDKKDQIVTLIRKYFREELTAEESSMLEAWLSEDQENRNLLTLFTNDDSMEAELRIYENSAKPHIWTKIQLELNGEIRQTGKIRRFFSKNARAVAVCAVIIFLVVPGFWYFSANNRFNIPPEVVSTISDKTQKLFALPTNKAALVLANGVRISLHEQPDGLIALQGGFRVFKHKDDLYYKSQSEVVRKDNQYNTITTPRGGHYRVILPDLSTITMNVASSIKFNVSSSVAIREIEMTGEAEFEITPNVSVPFRVTIPPANNHGSTGKVEVTGTNFNIHAYNDGDCKKITLLNGSLQVSTVYEQTSQFWPTLEFGPISEFRQTSAFIKALPISGIVRLNKGEQAQLQDNGSIKIVPIVDTDSVVSWKQGSVFFNRTPTRKVLNTLENWYDVEVVYETTKVPDYPFTGKITPDTDIETVIGIMQFQCDSLHLKFDRAQKKITVLP